MDNVAEAGFKLDGESIMPVIAKIQLVVRGPGNCECPGKNGRPLLVGMKLRFRSRWRAALLGVGLALLDFGCLQAAEKLEFNRDIRPLLSDRCFKCHGPDKASRKADLRLDQSESAYAERKKSHGHAIVPGKPDQSLLVKRIFSTDEDERMPPQKSNLSLAPEEREKIRRWIAEGAEYQPHWAFIPLPDSVPVAAVKDAAWPRNDIDHFILARLEKEGIKPSPEADKLRWLRRVTYDLTGLPPTLGEVDAFLADGSTNDHRESGGPPARLETFWGKDGGAMAGCRALRGQLRLSERSTLPNVAVS